MMRQEIKKNAKNGWVLTLLGVTLAVCSLMAYFNFTNPIFSKEIGILELVALWSLSWLMVRQKETKLDSIATRFFSKFIGTKKPPEEDSGGL